MTQVPERPHPASECPLSAFAGCGIDMHAAQAPPASTNRPQALVASCGDGQTVHPAEIVHGIQCVEGGGAHGAGDI